MNPGRELIKVSKPLGGSGPGQGLQTEHTVQPSPQFRGLSVPTHSFGGMPAAPSSPLLRGDMTLCASPEGMGYRSTGGPSLPLLRSGGDRTQVTARPEGSAARGHQPLVSVSLGPPVCRPHLVSSPQWDSAGVGGPPSGACGCPGLPPQPGWQAHCREESDLVWLSQH